MAKITMDDLLGVLTPEQLKLIEDWEKFLSTDVKIKKAYTADKINEAKKLLPTYVHFNLLTTPTVICGMWYAINVNSGNRCALNNIKINDLKTIENFYTVSVQEKISLDNLLIIYKDTEIAINSIYNDKDITFYANKTYSLFYIINVLTEGLGRSTRCNIITSFNLFAQKSPYVKELITGDSNLSTNIFLLGKNIKKLLMYLMPSKNRFYNHDGEYCYTATGISIELHKYGIVYSPSYIAYIVRSDTPMLLGVSIVLSKRNNVHGVTREELKTICLNAKYYMRTNTLTSYNYLLDKYPLQQWLSIMREFKDTYKLQDFNLNNKYILKTHGVLLEKFLQPYVDKYKKKELQLAS